MLVLTWNAEELTFAKAKFRTTRQFPLHGSFYCYFPVSMASWHFWINFIFMANNAVILFINSIAKLNKLNDIKRRNHCFQPNRNEMNATTTVFVISLPLSLCVCISIFSIYISLLARIFTNCTHVRDSFFIFGPLSFHLQQLLQTILHVYF